MKQANRPTPAGYNTGVLGYQLVYRAMLDAAPADERGKR